MGANRFAWIAAWPAGSSARATDARVARGLTRPEARERHRAMVGAAVAPCEGEARRILDLGFGRGRCRRQRRRWAWSPGATTLTRLGRSASGAWGCGRSWASCASSRSRCPLRRVHGPGPPGASPRDHGRPSARPPDAAAGRRALRRDASPRPRRAPAPGGWLEAPGAGARPLLRGARPARHAALGRLRGRGDPPGQARPPGRPQARGRGRHRRHFTPRTMRSGTMPSRWRSVRRSISSITSSESGVGFSPSSSRPVWTGL